MCPFDYTAVRLVERWARKPVNHTNWVFLVTPTDRPKSVRNRCLIELFCGVVCVVTLPFLHFCWCRGFCHRTESDLFLFLFIPAFTTNAMTSDFLSLISHGWVVTFQDSHRTVFTFRSWLDLLGVVLAFWISILKISKLLQNCWHRVIDITSFEKHLESSLDYTLNFCQNLVIFRSKNIYQKESLTRSSTVILCLALLQPCTNLS